MKHLVLIIFFVFVDRFSKYLAIHDLLPSWGGLFDYACNQRIAWNLPVSGAAFWVIWLPVVFFFFYYYLKYKRPPALGLVIAGALSNAIDRLTHGCVVDFISIGVFPLFNMADAMITIGIIYFLYFRLSGSTKDTPSSK